MSFEGIGDLDIICCQKQMSARFMHTLQFREIIFNAIEFFVSIILNKMILRRVSTIAVFWDTLYIYKT